MARDTVKMLVLETDAPHPDTNENRGGFSYMLNDLFTKAGNNHDPPLGIKTDTHFVVDDPDHGHEGRVPKPTEIPSDISAILITGSMYDAHGNDPWIQSLRSLISELWRTRPEMKFAGICFGHQLLALTLGAKVEPTQGRKWELAHTKMDLTTVGQRLFRTRSKQLAVHQMHQDQVTSVPSCETSDLLSEGMKVHVWASTEHTEIQGLYIRDRLFSSQGHLELGQEMVRKQVGLRQESGAIGEKDVEEVKYAEETAHLEHDGQVVAGAVLRFFHGDNHEID